MTNLTLWTRRDPFAEFDSLVRNAFGQSARPGIAPAFVPAAEISRDGDDALVRLELPGVDPANDVIVEIDNGRLVVRGERRDARSEQRDGRSLREVRYGAFRRSFRLPRHVSDDAITATYTAGVLDVRVAGVYAGTDARRIPVGVDAPATPQVEPAAEPSDN